MRIVVLRASNKPHRYSYQTVMLLKEKGYEVFPVHERLKEINGITVYPSIKHIKCSIDTITMYVSKKNSDLLSDDIIACKPKRIIFNPGAENKDLEKKAQEQCIKTINACTLVLLKTGQF